MRITTAFEETFPFALVNYVPNASSALRRIGMVLVEQNDEWAVGRRYFSLESMALLKVPQSAARIEVAA